MNYIKGLLVKGFKKFTSFEITFNEHMNILVGENEAGKSTILDAIKTVLNQQYRTSDKAVLKDLFNAEMVAAFQKEPSIKTLPRIEIEVELELDPKHKNAEYFCDEMIKSANGASRAISHLPVPFLSTVMGGIETGYDVRDIKNQGTKYK